jgi:hypothetical protein
MLFSSFYDSIRKMGGGHSLIIYNFRLEDSDSYAFVKFKHVLIDIWIEQKTGSGISH